MGVAEHLLHVDGKIRSNLAEILPASAFVALYSIARSPMLLLLAKERPVSNIPSFPVEFNNLHFRNDLGNAAGYDKDAESLPLSYLMGAGFANIGTVLISDNDGNYLSSSRKVNPMTPFPASNGGSNSLGLPSKGVEVVVRNIDIFREEYHPENFQIAGNIMGHPKQEGEEKLKGTVECLKRLLPYVDFVEINESCPNVQHDEIEDRIEYRLEKIVNARDAYRSKTGRKVPIFVKLASFGNVEHTVQSMTSMEIDGLVGVNTQKNYSDIRKRINKKKRRSNSFFWSQVSLK